MRRVLVLAICAALGAAVPAAAAPPPSAHVWVTTPDGALKMSDGGSVPFRPGGSDALTVTVDPSGRYQTTEGFGASITDSSAHVLSRLSRPARNATMRSLFAENRLSFLRQPIGSSDFVAGPH
jgi:glucosylceramidase